VVNNDALKMSKW
jgi:hypothetical protein